MAAGWLGVCAVGLTLIEHLAGRPLGHPGFVFKLVESVCCVVVALAAGRRAAELESTLMRCFEDSPAGVCLFDQRGCVVQCNRAFADFLGYTEQELLGMPHRNLLHPDEAKDLPPWPAAEKSGGKCGSRIRKFSSKSGDIRWGKSSLSALGGHKAGITVAVVHDVTLEQEALQSLESNEEALRELLNEVQRNEEQVLLLARAVESTTDSIVITDLSGSIEYVNPHFEKLTGYTRAEAYGKNPRILQSGRQPREFYADLWRTLKSGGVWNGRFINRRKDGTLYTEEATIAPVHDAHGIPQKYVAVKRDVTRLEELESQLRQAQKMEAVGQLAGGIAHDLNNVLQVVALASHLALISHDLEFKNERIKELSTAAEKGAGVIRQLLAFSRRQLMRPEVLNLNDVIGEAAKLLNHLLRDNIRLCLKLDPDLGRVEADPVQITQVILNLALNSRDAMPDGGLLEISTENFEVTAESESAGQTASGSYVRLIIRDTGTGMDEATKSHIFEPFFTTKETGKGTGLGLSTAYGIVIQSGGFLEFESTVGAGTAFFVSFPRIQTAIVDSPE